MTTAADRYRSWTGKAGAQFGTSLTFELHLAIDSAGAHAGQPAMFLAPYPLVCPLSRYFGTVLSTRGRAFTSRQ